MPTVAELPECVDTCILVDDGSSDATAELSRSFGLDVYVDDRHYGYGRNSQNF